MIDKNEVFERLKKIIYIRSNGNMNIKTFEDLNEFLSKGNVPKGLDYRTALEKDSSDALAFIMAIFNDQELSFIYEDEQYFVGKAKNKMDGEKKLPYIYAGYDDEKNKIRIEDFYEFIGKMKVGNKFFIDELERIELTVNHRIL